MISYEAQRTAVLLDNLVAEEARINALLRPGGYTIDEFALLVHDNINQQLLDEHLCRDQNWERFNVATDNVHTGPIRSGYSVEYFFYRHPDHAYRLEIMRLTSGVSPLHAPIGRPSRGHVALPVHASFKVDSEEAYAYARSFLGEELRYTEAQRCDSTYGRFSYWTPGGLPELVPYVKPRVNLRDEPGRYVIGA